MTRKHCPEAIPENVDRTETPSTMPSALVPMEPAIPAL